MTTIELESGPTLDYWTARAQGKNPLIRTDAGVAVCVVERVPYTPSTDWHEGGPLIERLQIPLRFPNPLLHAMREVVRREFGDLLPI